jgi:hypothetical protein
MESNIMRNRAQIDKSIVASVQEVKETIAVQLMNQRVRKFGLQDLWNIRRKAKLASSRARI